MTAQKNNRLGGQRQKRDFWLFNFMKIMKKVRWVVGALILALLPVTAQAANPDGTLGYLRIDVIAAHNLVVDSNVTSPPTYAPKAATLGAKICNDGDKTLYDVHAYIGNYIDGGTSTPGTYPVRDSDIDADFDTGTPLEWLKNTGKYSLTHESGSFTSDSDASRAWVGTIKPGACKTEYWIVSYPQCVNVSDGAGGY
ncbi:MAG: hypothetical protein D3920_12175, partial [Candidatus Electrothrix sp. AW2]|nr:hypothetical protein [Candidatus Electrothrix gigas]